MRYSFLIITLGLFFIACSKDKFTTKPQLKYKSVNTKELSRGQYLTFTLSFTDAEGDLDSIFIQKVTPQCPESNITDMWAVPEFSSGNNQEGELNITYGYGLPPLIQEPFCPFNDSSHFRFVLKDKAGNHSDTVSSEQVVIIKQ